MLPRLFLVPFFVGWFGDYCNAMKLFVEFIFRVNVRTRPLVLLVLSLPVLQYSFFCLTNMGKRNCAP